MLPDLNALLIDSLNAIVTSAIVTMAICIPRIQSMMHVERLKGEYGTE